MTDDYSHPELVRLVKGLEKSFTDFRSELRADISRMEGAYVTRGEFTAWQTAYDREQEAVREMVGELKANTAPVRVSPWLIAGFAVSAVVGGGSLITLVLNLINTAT